MDRSNNSNSGVVLVVKTALLHEVGYFNGYCKTTQPYLDAFFAPGNTTFMNRQAAENDPSYKQLIPYLILRYRSSVFSYIRGRSATEERLIAKRSIGLGGHIEPRDDSLFNDPKNIYGVAAEREVREEVSIRSAYKERIVALINDDSNEVGKVHLGIVHIWELSGCAVAKREAQITQVKFMTISDLRAIKDDLETWSQIALDILEGEGT